MATIPDSVKAQLDADWTGAGGAEPTYYVEEDFRTKPPLGQDAIWIMSRTLDTGARPINDTFVTEEHVLEIVVNTQTSADRLKEISDEVVRILNATAITDITYQRMKSRNRNSGELENIWVYQEVITYDLKQQMKSSAAAYGAGATGDFTITGDLIVGGDDIKDSSSAVVISFDGAGAIDTLETGTLGKLAWPQTWGWNYGDGASIGSYFGMLFYLLNNDNNCWMRGIIHVPPSWPATTQSYLKVKYVMGTAAQDYSCKFSIGSQGEGTRVTSFDIMTDSTSYDFTQTAGNWTWAINTVDISTSVLAGDVLRWQITSDALNGTVCYIGAVWIEHA